MPAATASELADFEALRPMVEPMVRLLRAGNGFLDMVFYDVEAARREMAAAGLAIETGDSGPTPIAGALEHLDLSALADPEGSILVVDAGAAPHVTTFADVTMFITWALTNVAKARNYSITGVGSSALGSAAFAWDISKALGEPVVAIVPGYGVADVIQQALGGWFGFGVHNYLVKTWSQAMLAQSLPGVASIGRRLLKSAPGHAEAGGGAPVFRRGCGSADVLHAILERVADARRVFGHSKGALAVGDAILDLPPGVIERLRVWTFGCAIDETEAAASYDQALGAIDALGILNSWGNPPEEVVFSHHSTNTAIPLSMAVEALVRGSEAARRSIGT